MKLTPINGNTETEGVEFIYRGITLIVARSGNTNFKKIFREKMKPYEDEFENDRLDNEQSGKILIECVANTVLVGWTNFVDVTGQDYEYSVENAIELLTDDEDCYDAIRKFSDNIENYLTDKEELLKGK